MNEEIEKGDVVVIYVEMRSVTYGSWELLDPGRDDHVRGAKVCVSVGGHRVAAWKRPVERLYPLDVGSPTEHAGDRDSSIEEENEGNGQETTIDSRRPKRRAAVKAHARLHRLKTMDLV